MDVRSNQVQCLPDGIGNSSLTTLNVELSQLSELPSDIFDGVLTELDIRSNQVKNLPHGIGDSSSTALHVG